MEEKQSAHDRWQKLRIKLKSMPRIQYEDKPNSFIFLDIIRIIIRPESAESNRNRYIIKLGAIIHDSSIPTITESGTVSDKVFTLQQRIHLNTIYDRENIDSLYDYHNLSLKDDLKALIMGLYCLDTDEKKLMIWKLHRKFKWLRRKCKYMYLAMLAKEEKEKLNRNYKILTRLGLTFGSSDTLNDLVQGILSLPDNELPEHFMSDMMKYPVGFSLYILFNMNLDHNLVTHKNEYPFRIEQADRSYAKFKARTYSSMIQHAPANIRKLKSRATSSLLTNPITFPLIQNQYDITLLHICYNRLADQGIRKLCYNTVNSGKSKEFILFAMEGNREKLIVNRKTKTEKKIRKRVGFNKHTISHTIMYIRYIIDGKQLFQTAQELGIRTTAEDPFGKRDLMSAYRCADKNHHQPMTLINNERRRLAELEREKEMANPTMLPLPDKKFIPPALHQYIIYTKGDLLRAGYELHHCIGSYHDRINYVHLRKGTVCLQLSPQYMNVPFRLGVTQCHDAHNETTEESENFRSMVEREIRNHNYNLDKEAQCTAVSSTQETTMESVQQQ